MVLIYTISLLRCPSGLVSLNLLDSSFLSVVVVLAHHSHMMCMFNGGISDFGEVLACLIDLIHSIRAKRNRTRWYLGDPISLSHDTFQSCKLSQLTGPKGCRFSVALSSPVRTNERNKSKRIAMKRRTTNTQRNTRNRNGVFVLRKSSDIRHQSVQHNIRPVTSPLLPLP